MREVPSILQGKLIEPSEETVVKICGVVFNPSPLSLVKTETDLFSGPLTGC
jgi:hypothetical protein